MTPSPRPPTAARAAYRAAAAVLTAAALTAALAACDAAGPLDGGPLDGGPLGSPAAPAAAPAGADASGADAPWAVDGPLCVFQVAGTSNAKGNGNLSLTADAEPGTALMWDPDGGVRHLDDPAFGNHEGSMWPAFAAAFYETSGCVPFLGSSADGGGRIAAVAFPEDCEPFDPRDNVYNSWHPACENGMFERAVEEAAATLAAALAAYPEREVVFGGWLGNWGNDQIDIYHGRKTAADYEASLGELLAAFADVYPAAAYPEARLHLIEPVVFRRSTTDPAWLAVWESVSGAEQAACAAAPACAAAARKSRLVFDSYAACSTSACRRQYYVDDHHWNWDALNRVGDAAGERVGRLFRGL